MGLISLAARWLIAGIFLRAGLAKATGLSDFHTAVTNYEFLPPAFVPVVATALPFAEIVAAVFLALGVVTVVAAAVLAVLLLAFAAAIALNLAKGRVFDCGCAGSAVAPRQISWPQVAGNLALAVTAAAVAVAPPSSAELWLGPGGLVRVATQSGGTLPVLLAVLVWLIVLAPVRQAFAVRRLGVLAKVQLEEALPVSTELQRK